MIYNKTYYQQVNRKEAEAKKIGPDRRSFPQGGLDGYAFVTSKAPPVNPVKDLARKSSNELKRVCLQIKFFIIA